MHYKEKDCLVEGPLTNLKQSMIQFSRPRKTFQNDRYKRFTDSEKPAGKAKHIGFDIKPRLFLMFIQ